MLTLELHPTHYVYRIFKVFFTTSMSTAFQLQYQGAPKGLFLACFTLATAVVRFQIFCSRTTKKWLFHTGDKFRTTAGTNHHN